ncbi:MAG: (2Fe-2S)-binding protein [Sarcina sp.]
MDKEQRDKILATFSGGCRCMGVSVDRIKTAIQNGADTVEKVGAKTSAGTGCGRCKQMIQILIDEKDQ